MRCSVLSNQGYVGNDTIYGDGSTQKPFPQEKLAPVEPLGNICVRLCVWEGVHARVGGWVRDFLVLLLTM